MVFKGIHGIFPMLFPCFFHGFPMLSVPGHYSKAQSLLHSTNSKRMTTTQHSGIPWYNTFENIKLVPNYSKSLSRKNSKCLDFVFVQVTHIAKKGRISPSCYMKSKDDSHSIQWHTKDFRNVKLVSHYSKSVSHKNSKCTVFCWYK